MKTIIISTVVIVVVVTIIIGFISMNEQYVRSRVFAEKCYRANGVISSIMTGFFTQTNICSEKID